MKITQLTAENVKRLRAVTIRPDGSLVQISGRNAQGKTSVLDAIEMALGGAPRSCPMPIRSGERNARIVCTLDSGLVVKRTFTAGGGTSLVVENGEGARYTSPQAVLDKLVGKLTFDPLAFTRMPAKQQLEALRSLVGLDFADADAKRASLFVDRTATNKAVAALRVQVESAPHHAGAPATEVSIAGLTAELQEAHARNRAAEASSRKLDRLMEDAVRAEAAVVEAEGRLAKARAEAAQRRDEVLLRQRLPLPAGVDTAPIQARINGAELENRRARENARRVDLLTNLADTEAEAARLTAAIEHIDEIKRASVAAARFPVGGLSFDDAGVLLNGVPFQQASSAEQMFAARPQRAGDARRVRRRPRCPGVGRARVGR
jgi:hypothetical protein